MKTKGGWGGSHGVYLLSSHEAVACVGEENHRNVYEDVAKTSCQPYFLEHLHMRAGFRVS
jgi:hypothetical protein